MRGTAGRQRSGNELRQALIFLAWLTAIAGLVVIVRFRMPVIGVYVAPDRNRGTRVGRRDHASARLTMPQSLRSAWLPVHVTFALLGYALFVLAAIVSLVYLVYERRLKAKRPLLPSRRADAESRKARSHQLSPARLGLPDVEPGDRHRRDLGGCDLGSFLVVGTGRSRGRW